jgi:hypothetical protein
MYVKALAILLLLSGLIAFCWKLYDAGGDAREAEVRLEYTNERLALISERDAAILKAENNITDQKPVWRERKEKAREVIVDCSLPDIHIGVLRESGVFTGSGLQVRDTGH